MNGDNVPSITFEDRLLLAVVQGVVSNGKYEDELIADKVFDIVDSINQGRRSRISAHSRYRRDKKS